MKPLEVKKALHKKQVRKFQAEKGTSVSPENKADKIPATKSEPPLKESTDSPDVPPLVPKKDRYNFQDAVQEDKQTFEIVEHNTDFKLGRQVSTLPKGTQEKKGIKPKNKNRLYQKKQTNADDSAQTVSSERDSKAEAEKSEKKETAESGEPSAEDSPQNDDFQFDRTKRYEQRAEHLQQKAEKAKGKAPHKTKIKRSRVYDEQKQKAKNRLRFEKEPKPIGSENRYTFVKSAAAFASQKALYKVHSKIRETERDNSSVEAAHKTEQKAERLTAYSMRTAKYINGQRKAAPYKKAARLQQKAERSEVKALYDKTLAEHPELKKSQVKKFLQKQQIKKQYQKAKRAEQATKQAKRAAQNAEKAASRTAAFVWRHKAFFGIVIGIGLLIAWLGSVLSSCSVMLTTGTNSLMVSSYFAEDADIYAAENYYVGLEQGLQNKVDRVETDYPGYDEYRYNVAGIGHNPYELISYLTAVYQDFQFNDIKSGLDELFNVQYHLTITETTEQRTDDAGNTYDYKVLSVTLTNGGFTAGLTEDQRELYDIYLASKGNRDYLFANDIYANESVPPSYTIPGEALSDETFRRLITEAEKYLGFPYVWGGSSPSTSFDCSGFVCWVFQNSGVYPLSRTTAQGIYNQCAVISPQDAKPGDIIFFKGTYNTSEVSHVGIYVGNGMMIHCGNPIQYASVNTSYWQQHFFAYGRLTN